jgi:pimeloyl-ACP methyl ester carboxylesterase
MSFQIKENKGFKYIEEGEGEVLLLLHGLFGALSNWADIINTYSKSHKVVIPMLPIYEMPIRSAGLEGLEEYLTNFVKYKGYDKLTLIGNSLGGHIGLIYTLKYPEKVKRLVLTGSSGLFEDSMGGSFPKRGSYDYVKERVEYTFYDPKVATKELVDEVYEIVGSIPKCMRIIGIAKSAQRNNLSGEVGKITCPTLLIWGLNDTITPPSVGHDFNRLMPNSELHFIDKCGHAPMMERSAEFAVYLTDFLQRNPIV